MPNHFFPFVGVFAVIYPIYHLLQHLGSLKIVMNLMVSLWEYFKLFIIRTYLPIKLTNRALGLNRVFSSVANQQRICKFNGILFNFIRDGIIKECHPKGNILKIENSDHFLSNLKRVFCKSSRIYLVID